MCIMVLSKAGDALEKAVVIHPFFFYTVAYKKREVKSLKSNFIDINENSAAPTNWR